MAATRPPFPRQNQPRPQLNFPSVPFNSGNPTYPRPHFNGMLYGNHPNIAVNHMYYGGAPAPPPPPKPPVNFISPNSNYSDQRALPPPPGTSSPPRQLTVPVQNSGESFGPLIPPPLPPLFPYLSQSLHDSLNDGAAQCGISFVEESADLSFIPVIIDDNDLKKMTESVKTQFEETRQQNLLLYEDIINPNWPKELRDMFQPLYCKLCKLTLSSPVVARDHYKGKRHIRAAEVWMQNNPSCKVQRQPQSNNRNSGSQPISGTIKPVGETYRGGGPASYSQSQRPSSCRTDRNATFYQNQQGHDRTSFVPPPYKQQQNSTFKRNAGGGNVSQQSQSPPEFIPAYRAALAPSGPTRKKPKKEGGGSSNFGYCSLCDVHHTSAVTAEQHINGKNHKAKLNANKTGGDQTRSNQYYEDSNFGNFAFNANSTLSAAKQPRNANGPNHFTNR